MSIIRWLEEPIDQRYSRAWVIMRGLFAGVGIGTGIKYWLERLL